MEKLKQYILALTNLYGMVPAGKVVEIYNMQNEDQVSIDEVEAYFDEDLSKNYVYAHKDHFVHETIMVFEEFKSMLRKKGDKPYYIPEKQELIKYSDMLYYEKPKQYYKLLESSLSLRESFATVPGNFRFLLKIVEEVRKKPTRITRSVLIYLKI